MIQMFHIRYNREFLINEGLNTANNGFSAFYDCFKDLVWVRFLDHSGCESRLSW